MGDVENGPEQGETLKGLGRVFYNNLEGGFYALLGDDGERLDPHPMPEEFQKDGVRVRYVVRTRPGIMCFHMWGKIVEVIHIEAVD